MASATAEGADPGAPVALLRRVGALLLRVPRQRAWIPVVLWMGLIWLSSATPGRREPAGAAWALVANLGHAPLFGLLGLWLALLLPRRDGWPRLDPGGALLVLAGVLAFGVVDELHQAGVARRDLSALDLLTDVTGAACVLWVAALVGRPTASGTGLAGRLAVGLGLCLGAAAVATWLPAFFPGVAWM